MFLYACLPCILHYFSSSACLFFLIQNSLNPWSGYFTAPRDSVSPGFTSPLITSTNSVRYLLILYLSRVLILLVHVLIKSFLDLHHFPHKQWGDCLWNQSINSWRRKHKSWRNFDFDCQWLWSRILPVKEGFREKTNFGSCPQQWFHCDHWFMDEGTQE